MSAPVRLPLVAPHTREHTYCAYCPKLCRFSCPVSTVQGRETTTPWGKMTSLHHVASGHLPMERSHAATWWACTGCMRCRSFCDHGNEVAAALNAGRAEARQAGAAPPEALAVVERHETRAARAKRAARTSFADAQDRTSGTVFVPGCTACVTAPQTAQDGLRAVEGLTRAPARVEADACCGLPLLDAGHREGFLRHAQAFLDRLQAAERVIFQDPGCLHALRVVAPQLGLTHDLHMVHLSEAAHDALSRVRPVKMNGHVRWHDPCRLGRGLGIYDAPRAVLARLLDRAPEEFHQRREAAECSGAGGQVPRTDPATARAIAQERLRGHEELGGGTVVTGCPGAAHMLGREGQASSTTVVDLAMLLARGMNP